MARVMITLQPDERDALAELAANERRDPRSQAALLIRSGLVLRGLLKPRTGETTGQGQGGVEQPRACASA